MFPLVCFRWPYIFWIWQLEGTSEGWFVKHRLQRGRVPNREMITGERAEAADGSWIPEQLLS